MLTLHGYGSSILTGSLVTISVALLSLIIAVLLGIGGAAAGLSRSPILRGIVVLYTTLIRGIPDLVLMLLVFFGGQVLVNRLAMTAGHEAYIDINPYLAGVTTIGFIFGAYMTETFRGAVLALERGQLEAGIAMGMTSPMVFRRIMIPQTVRHALPSFGNNWLVMIKTTAIVSVIGLDDMVRKAALAGTAVHQPLLFYLTVAGLYLVFTTLSSVLLRWGEQRFRIGEPIKP